MTPRYSPILDAELHGLLLGVPATVLGESEEQRCLRLRGIAQ
jgi:hypothetical protein